MPSRFVLIAALAAAVMLSVAACGGSDSGGGSSSPLTHAEFLAAADAICSEADEKNNALPEPTSIDELGAAFRDQLNIFEEQLAGLERLTPPAEDREQVDRAVVLLGEVNATVAGAADAFESGDVDKAGELLDGLDPIGAELDELAADIGLTACGSSS